MKIEITLARGLAALAVLAHGAGAAPQRYTVHEIKSPQGLVRAVALNARGEVAGYVHPPGSIASVSFLWKDGAMSLLPAPDGAQIVWPWSLDDHGTVYGTWHDSTTTGLVLRPLAWRAGELRELPGLFEGMGALLFCSPSGEHVVTDSLPFDDGTPGWTDEFGWEDEPDFTRSSGDPRMPYHYSAGVTRPLGTFRGAWRTSVVDVNDRGVAVGRVDADGSNQHDAVMWDPEEGALLLGSGGRRSAWPKALNDSGLVVGFTNTTRSAGDVNDDANRRPFLWQAGRWEHLVPPAPYSDGEAVDANDAGQVVGRWIDGPTGWAVGQAWIRVAGVEHPLEQLVDAAAGWSFTHVAAINDAGQVLAGEHVGPNIGDMRWALLTPEN